MKADATSDLNGTCSIHWKGSICRSYRLNDEVLSITCLYGFYSKGSLIIFAQINSANSG